MPNQTNLADLPVGTQYTHRHSGRTFTVAKRQPDTPPDAVADASGGWNYITNIAEILSVPEDAGAPNLDALYQSYNRAALELAIAEGQDVEFDYKDAQGVDTYSRALRPTELKFVPNGVVVVGEDLDEEDTRSFRIDRITSRVWFA